jgi:hypothetical protein
MELDLFLSMKDKMRLRAAKIVLQPDPSIPDLTKKGPTTYTRKTIKM